MPHNGPVILVEDDLDDQQTFSEVYNAIGLKNEVIIFDNGVKALDYLMTTAQKPFIILCDINMPMMDGFEFRCEINANPYLRQKSIPFVFLSTSSMKKDVEMAYENTTQGYLVKPSSIKEFENMLTICFEYWKINLHPNYFR